MSYCSRHCDCDKRCDFKHLEVMLEDILVQLQQQKQRQYQNQTQAQTQSDRTKFENNGNPNITIKNEANALSIAAIIIIVRLFGGHGGKLKVNKKSVEEFVDLCKEISSSFE
ncbi:hypothetical protein [Virgibacillus proomii]|jgi:hypothetical protein|uniref:hypothetical protein n=1 Tax=Virgibacillus proomii TaxID=84407 RepID=UPI0009854E84|nr:hypothetical protein [Virgibacillus proomii]